MLIDSKKLKKQVSKLRVLPCNRWSDYDEGKDDAICFVLDIIMLFEEAEKNNLKGAE